MLEELSKVSDRAHIDTVHPNAIDWPTEITQEEKDFISIMAFGEKGHHEKAIVYVIKELAQLAEIEKHVTAVIAIILSEMQGEKNSPFVDGHVLHNALSCFGAEEMRHADMFYRYVRLLGGREFKCENNLFAQRVGLYQGNDSVWVKLAALCSSAYIGESVITVFENRCVALDPENKYFFTKLLVIHGLDEARHIKVDHIVFDKIIPLLTKQEFRRMKQILTSTEDLNKELSVRFGEHAKQIFHIDYTEGNVANATQMALTGHFRELVFGDEKIKSVDEGMTLEQKEILMRFSMRDHVH